MQKTKGKKHTAPLHISIVLKEWLKTVERKNRGVGLKVVNKKDGTNKHILHFTNCV